jgi:hypothetical protein
MKIKKLNALVELILTDIDKTLLAYPLTDDDILYIYNELTKRITEETDEILKDY